MAKSEVYSWRVSPAVKSRLEEAARRERRTVAALLDDIVAGHLNASHRARGRDDERQQRLHQDAAHFAGCFSGADPGRSAGVRTRVRARLRRGRGR